jgi:hypothetical protein
VALFFIKLEFSRGFLLLVGRTVVTEVNSATLDEEEIFKGLLPLALSDLLNLLDLTLSAVEHVPVVGNLGAPEPPVLLTQIFVLRLEFN